MARWKNGGNGVAICRRSACPRCRRDGRDRSGDNLATYSDGHSYCYACGYTRSAAIEERLRPRMEKVVTGVSLPPDVSENIGIAGRAYLQRYGITRNEVDDHQIRWSESRKLLIFPMFRGGGNEVIAWTGRNFNVKQVPLVNGRTSDGEEASFAQRSKGFEVLSDGPKYLTEGPIHDILYTVEPDRSGYSDICVLVEDIISAIKVGRIVPAAPLFGSKIPLELVRKLSVQFKTLGIWLDGDKSTEAVVAALRASQIMPTFVISSSLDPKDYTEEKIEALIDNAAFTPVPKSGESYDST